MRLPKLLSLAAAALLCGASSVSAFTITNINLYTGAWDAVGPAFGTYYNNLAFPASTTVNNVDGVNSASTQIDFQGTGDQATLFLGFDHTRGGTKQMYGQSQGWVEFTVSSNTTYSITGNYTAADVGAAGLLTLFGALVDTTTNVELFVSTQESRTTVNESFALGGLGGDVGNAFQGSLTGSLIAGHTYYFGLNAGTFAFPDADSGTTATGNLTLKIGGGAPTASVPDSAATLGLLALALGLAAVPASRRTLAKR